MQRLLQTGGEAGQMIADALSGGGGGGRGRGDVGLLTPPSGSAFPMPGQVAPPRAVDRIGSPSLASRFGGRNLTPAALAALQRQANAEANNNSRPGSAASSSGRGGGGASTSRPGSAGSQRSEVIDLTD